MLPNGGDFVVDEYKTEDVGTGVEVSCDTGGNDGRVEVKGVDVDVSTERDALPVRSVVMGDAIEVDNEILVVV